MLERSAAGHPGLEQDAVGRYGRQSSPRIVEPAMPREETRPDGVRLPVRRGLRETGINDADELTAVIRRVNEATQALVECRHFEREIRRWLGEVAGALEADHAMVGGFPETKRLSAAALGWHAWSRPGFSRSSQGVAPRTADFDSWIERLRRGERIVAHRDELVDPASVRFWEANACFTACLFPISFEGNVCGWLSFDWAKRRNWSPLLGELLALAANGVALALKQREQGEKIPATDQARLVAEHDRAEELSRVNAALRRPLATLADTEDVLKFLRSVLEEIFTQAGACAVYLFGFDRSADCLRLAGAVRDGVYLAEGAGDEPEAFREGISLQENAVLRHILACDELLLSALGDLDQAAWPEAYGVLQSLGWQAIAGRALVAGCNPVGCLALAFREPTALSVAQTELIEALSHQLVLAMELTRLGKEARQAAEEAAVASERTRIARDLHDTLAQGFTGVLVQLGAAEQADIRGDRFAMREARRRAEQLARESLVDARRAVHALRPSAFVGQSDLEECLRALLGRMTVGAHVQAKLTRVGTPRAVDPAVQDVVLRLAQETIANMLKHSDATVFSLEIAWLTHTLMLTAGDNGRGFDPNASTEGFGLIGMRERLRPLGGRAALHSAPGLGTILVFTIPVP